MGSSAASPGRAFALPEPQGPVHPAEHAFFLDVDGTLLELAPSPDAVVVEPHLIDLLRALAVRAYGAVAFVSGRSIATLDALFQPLLLPAAGLHGFERRDASGTYRRHTLPPGEALGHARLKLRELAARNPGLLLEDKRFALALHYRQAPNLEPLVLGHVEDIAAHVGESLKIQRGRMVVELRPASASKATAIAEFMREPPFAGRRPVCLGDDLTDECAFEWVNAAGGVSIAVGVARDTAATAHLHSVAAARLWLSRIVEQP
ncbi:MAG: trehalose-phosphatase [Steroidobacteraceae bacterium]|nr:trehalose-phosphatase [Steroidobacteraceae bacterium]